MARRSVEEERNRLKQLEREGKDNAGTRVVYWYSKGWAEFMKKRIEECGAEGTFVDGFSFSAANE